jgi:hypothetical protein
MLIDHDWFVNTLLKLLLGNSATNSKSNATHPFHLLSVLRAAHKQWNRQRQDEAAASSKSFATHPFYLLSFSNPHADSGYKTCFHPQHDRPQQKNAASPKALLRTTPILLAALKSANTED